VVGGQISVDKNISTENGNPYGAFVNAAVQKIGQPPSRIAVTSATFTLDPVPMVVVFDSATVFPSDYASLVGGSFKDVLTGTGSAGFATRGATADIKATLTFEAFD
jgi:hypothetical protein